MNEGDKWGPTRGQNMVYPFRHTNTSISVIQIYLGLSTPITHTSTTMANHPLIMAHLLRLIESTYEQLEDEMAWLSNQSNLTAMILHNTQLEHRAHIEVLSDLSIHTEDAINRHLIIMMEPYHLDNLTPALHIEEQNRYVQLLRQRDQVQDTTLLHLIENHNECRLLDERLRELNFLGSLVTLAHLIKVDRQDLV